VNPLAIETLKQFDHDTSDLNSKSWDVFAAPGAPVMNFVITVCDQAAGEVCPVWPGHPITANWGLPDPSQMPGTDDDRCKAFRDTYRALRNRIRLFTSLRLDQLDALAIKRAVDAIHKAEPVQ
jgi:arsenate reductase